MTLPAGFLDDLRARVPVSAVIGRRVTWDARKSNPAKGDFWACCPFHQEKSPSFHADDRRGFYHCFGCHAKGDAVTFLREHENLSFIEAVAELARMAGVAMPAQDPEAASRAGRRDSLVDWMEQAAAFYQAQLAGAKGAAARAYLARRRVAAATLAAFGVGYAPPDRAALCAHLIANGASEAALIEAGLVARPDDGGAPYDRFRDRIVFPIRDGRGRCIAFGGRAMSAEARAKYLNSPETPLFDKARTLYNLGPARAAAAKSGTLIVVEGYMDVIALVEAGFDHAVAPLGTAVTEHHLRELWRCVDEPVIALDGDAAGLRAAARVADVALPLLAAGKSLRFALLPAGRDPDDLIRAEGAQAMRAVIDKAEPLSAMLWRRETEGRAFDAPEARAAFDARLRTLLGAIADPSVREHYRAAFRERRRTLFAPASGPGTRRHGAASWSAGRRDGARRPPAMPRPETRATALGRAGSAETRGREAAVLLTLLRHPTLAEKHHEALERLAFAHADLDALRGALLSALLDCGEMAALASHVSAHVGEDAAARLAREPRVSCLPWTRTDAPTDEVDQGLRELLERMRAEAIRAELVAEEASHASDDDPSARYERSKAATHVAHEMEAGLAPVSEAREELISEMKAKWLGARRGDKQRSDKR
ncbi:MAG: DNA primase [Rhodobacteraceae bacterium]|nr:MAG: DNA primase [Paracoccaceae bacterium]